MGKAKAEGVENKDVLTREHLLGLVKIKHTVGPGLELSIHLRARRSSFAFHPLLCVERCSWGLGCFVVVSTWAHDCSLAGVGSP